jgi:exonuclease SbcC
MIPLKLAVKNFMCYGDNVPPLHFDTFHMACLCGNNGNGKSALLDAITWALWGKTRAKSDDDLVRLGQDKMEVEFEFTVGENRYRILRKRAKGGLRRAGHSILELQVATPQGFKPITGNTLQETQQRITEILHMDYHTFINSALLLQGRADEFTIKQPWERKKVLADILNLSLYDELEEQARGLAKQREIECANLEGKITEVDDELAKKEGYQIELHEVRAALSQLDAQVKGQDGILNQLRQAKKGLELKGEQLSQAQERLAQIEDEVNRLESQLDQHRQNVVGYEATLAQGGAIEEGYQELLAIRRENEAFNLKLMQHAALTERRSQLERVIERAKGELLAERSVLQSQIQRLQIKSSMTPSLEQELSQIQSMWTQLDKLGQELSQKRERFQELSSQLHYLKSVNARLGEELRDIRAKSELLSRGNAHCPLCETELGFEGRQRLITKYGQEEQSKGELYQDNESKIRQDERESQMVRSEIAELEDRINKERAMLQGREIALNKELSEAQEAAKELVQAKSLLAEIEGRLERSDFAPEEQSALGDLLSQAEALAYDAEKHQAARERLAQLEAYEDSQRRLSEARGFIDQERASLSQAEEGISRWLSARDAETERQNSLANELQALPQLISEIEEAEGTYNALLTRQAQGRQMLGAVQGKIDRCLQLGREKEEKAKALEQAIKEKEIYEELSVAFGKKGIQALIIEQALPEIESEANRLLSQMTDGKMSLRLESQRQTKKGEVVETLDIKISDELGTRSYEMFSGGEAFRIDFALRIALSKLLARRAGAPLPTLFIDEGFGSQDSLGRGRLLEAINSIQDDFEKIIIITHIKELQELFPVRIEVIKTAEGSTLLVS